MTKLLRGSCLALALAPLAWAASVAGSSPPDLSLDPRWAPPPGNETCAGVSLLANCSFEAPAVAAGSCQLFSTGADLGGWTVVGAPGNVNPCSTSFKVGGYSLPAQDGKQSMDLTGTSNTPTGVSQTVATKRGERYRLSFWVGNVVDPGGPFGTSSSVNVLVNGTSVLLAQSSEGAGAPRLAWKPFAVSFTAPSESTTIALMNMDPCNDTSNFVDNVVLAPMSDRRAPAR